MVIIYYSINGSILFTIATSFVAAGAITNTYVFAGVLSSSVAISITIPISNYFSFIFDRKLAIILTLITIVSIVILSVNIINWFHKTLYKMHKLYIFWLVINVSYILLVFLIFFIYDIVLNTRSIYLLVFFSFIPIINAYYDWLSLGLTRYLLRRSLDEGRHFFMYALIDFLVAIILLLALSITIVAAVAGLNAIAPTEKPPIDLTGILSMLRSEPGNPALWWIYAMIFSTMLPTYFHLGVALTSLPMLRFMPRWRVRVAQRLYELKRPDDSYSALVGAARYLTLEKVYMVAMSVLALGALTGLLLWAMPGFARFLLFLCEETARLLGTDISPGPVAPFIRWV